MSRAADRLREFASIGAGHAANALAGVFDRVVLMDPPRCRWVRLAEIAGSVFEPEQWIGAVFADLEGPVSGQVGLLLDRDVVDEVLRRMLGDRPESKRAELSEIEISALGELGNIALSAAAEALGDLHGAIVLPSVPRVGYDMAGALLVEAVHPRIAKLPAYLVEAALVERAGSLRAHFVWIPEP